VDALNQLSTSAIVEIFVGDLSELKERLAADVQKAADAALEARGVFTIALCGGSVATTFFPRLARVPIDWSRTDFFWVDERAVLPTDPESNYSAAVSLWLDPASVPDARRHRMRAEDPDLQRAAAIYEQELTSIAGTPPQLDLVLLGVGPDGHIASLFPGRPISQRPNHFVEVVDHAPKPPPQRLTLTLPVLAGARHVAVIALGESKAEAIRTAMERRPGGPLERLILTAEHLRLLLDAAAASLLPAHHRPG
jgi:6-phosphogluconolactonase